MDTSIELYGTQPQTCAHAKHSAHDGKDVDDVTHPPIDLVSNQRVKTGADGHRQALPVTHEGQQKTNNYVHDPSMDTPVKEGQVHGILSQLVVCVP